MKKIFIFILLLFPFWINITQGMIDYDKLYSWSDDKEEPVIETDTQVQPKSELDKYILQLKNSWVPEEEAWQKVKEWQKQRWFDVFDEKKQDYNENSTDKLKLVYLLEKYNQWSKENPEIAMLLWTFFNIFRLIILILIFRYIFLFIRWIIRIILNYKEKFINSFREEALLKMSWLNGYKSREILNFMKDYPQNTLDLIEWKISFEDTVNKIKKNFIKNIDYEILLETLKKELQPLIEESKKKALEQDIAIYKAIDSKINTLVSKIEKKLKKLKDKKNDIGEWYDTIKENKIWIKWNDLSILYNKWVLELKDKYTHFSTLSKNTLKGIKSEFDKVVKQVWNWEIKYKHLKALKNNIQKIQIKEWLWIIDDDILFDFNEKFNNYLIEKIPEYKKLDVEYNEIKELYSKVYDANWNIKDNLYNILNNVLTDLLFPTNSIIKKEISNLLWIKEDELFKLSRELKEWNSKKFEKAISVEEKIKGAWTAKEIESWINKLNITKPNRIKKILSEIKTNEKLKEWYEKINNAVKADKIVGWDKLFTKAIFDLIDSSNKKDVLASETLYKVEKAIGKNEMLKIKLYKSIFDIVGWQRIPSFVNIVFQPYTFSEITSWLLSSIYFYFQRYPDKALKMTLKNTLNLK